MLEELQEVILRTEIDENEYIDLTEEEIHLFVEAINNEMTEEEKTELKNEEDRINSKIKDAQSKLKEKLQSIKENISDETEEDITSLTNTLMALYRLKENTKYNSLIHHILREDKQKCTLDIVELKEALQREFMNETNERIKIAEENSKTELEKDEVNDSNISNAFLAHKGFQDEDKIEERHQYLHKIIIKSCLDSIETFIGINGSQEEIEEIKEIINIFPLKD